MKGGASDLLILILKNRPTTHTHTPLGTRKYKICLFSGLFLCVCARVVGFIKRELNNYYLYTRVPCYLPHRKQSACDETQYIWLQRAHTRSIKPIHSKMKYICKFLCDFYFRIVSVYYYFLYSVCLKIVFRYDAFVVALSDLFKK